MQKKILETYQWDNEKINEIIRYHSKIDCPQCKAMNLRTTKFCNQCGHTLSPEIQIRDISKRPASLDENEIICFKCNTVNLYEKKSCINCGNSLTGEYILEKLSKEMIITKTEQKTSGIEYMPCKTKKPDEEKLQGIKEIISIEFFPQYMDILQTVSSPPFQISYNSIVSINVYREQSMEEAIVKPAVIVVQGVAHKLGSDYDFKDIYVCLIQSTEVIFKIIEGNFDFRKSLGKDKKQLFKDNFKILVEKLYQLCPQTEVDKGVYILLGLDKDKI